MGMVNLSKVNVPDSPFLVIRGPHARISRLVLEAAAASARGLSIIAVLVADG